MSVLGFTKAQWRQFHRERAAFFLAIARSARKRSDERSVGIYLAAAKQERQDSRQLPFLDMKANK